MSREAIIDGVALGTSCQKLQSQQKTSADISKSVTRWQDGFNAPGEINEDWQMQLYDADELKTMLKVAGSA